MIAHHVNTEETINRKLWIDGPRAYYYILRDSEIECTTNDLSIANM